MLKQIKFIFLLVYCLLTTYLSAVVIEAPSLEGIEKELRNLDENALVVLDVDYTLIIPNDLILAPCGEERFQKFMKNLRALGEKGEILGSKISLHSKVSIIDERIFNIIEFLKRKHIKVIALTAMPTGGFGLIPNAEEWRVNQLRLLGINLDWAFPKIDSITLEGFEGKKTLPVFKKGVLASAKYPKGRVLSAFLKHIQWKPSQIVFVDDRMEYINSVEAELEKENIPHVSFHYTAATNKVCQLDEEIADFQLNYLLEKEKWLSDEEASKIIKETIVKCL